MGKKINIQIRENFKKYEILINDLKNSTDKVIILDEIKRNHQNTRQKKTAVTHLSLDEKIELIVESDKYNKRDFKFKLRAPESFDEPFFRFDSNGRSHKNTDPNIELHEQKVDTPHFHRFDRDGRCIAYKTESLKQKSEAEALLNDISLSMAHYCDESNTYSGNNYIEVVQVPYGEMDLNFENNNPLNGVSYD